jgi:hypothetical protein
MSKSSSQSSATAAVSGPSSVAPKKPRQRLAPSQKYEVFVTSLTGSSTQRELAEKYGVDRVTIRSICSTAKQGALDALAQAMPGRKGLSAEAVELNAAKERIGLLEKTVAEQAMKLHLVEGKDGWD